MKTILSFARMSMIISSIFYAGSCTQMKDENFVATASERASEKIESEQAYPGQTGVEKKGHLFGRDITYTEINGEAVFEGDIILSKEQLNAEKGARTSGTGVSLNAQRWADNIVYYTIDKSVINTSAIYSAIWWFETSTPLKFVQRTTQYNYVTFKVARGFSSSIGVVGGQQFINLGIAYKTGSVMHEIAHTVGMFHEHTRNDRDQTINVNFQNIATANYAYFQTNKQSGTAGFDYDKMDLGSITMLDSYAYSSNGQPTMTKKDGQTYTIQRQHLSANDSWCLTAMYSNLYAVNFNNLVSGDSKKGKQAHLAVGWGETQAVTSDPYFTYAAKNGTIFRINPLNGEAKPIAYGLSKVQAMVLLKGFLYVINDGTIMKVNTDTGAVKKVGSQYWLPALDLAYYNGFFYIMTKNAIFRLTPETDNYVQITSVSNATEMTIVGGNLYYIKNSTGTASGIYRLNLNSPFIVTLQFGNKAFSAQAQMTTFEGNIFVTDYGYLYKLDQNGAASELSYGWSGATHLTALSPYNY